ncbi:hypothetical protein C8R47DRAFT_1076445 [Mycena vitilis]|nr:hypothetical protein C8R47DRAFT_1076445 [Mycena vitilis]
MSAIFGVVEPCKNALTTERCRAVRGSGTPRTRRWNRVAKKSPKLSKPEIWVDPVDGEGVMGVCSGLAEDRGGMTGITSGTAEDSDPLDSPGQYVEGFCAWIGRRMADRYGGEGRKTRRSRLSHYVTRREQFSSSDDYVMTRPSNYRIKGIDRLQHASDFETVNPGTVTARSSSSCEMDSRPSINRREVTIGPMMPAGELQILGGSEEPRSWPPVNIVSFECNSLRVYDDAGMSLIWQLDKEMNEVLQGNIPQLNRTIRTEINTADFGAAISAASNADSTYQTQAYTEREGQGKTKRTRTLWSAKFRYKFCTNQNLKFQFRNQAKAECGAEIERVKLKESASFQCSF